MSGSSIVWNRAKAVVIGMEERIEEIKIGKKSQGTYLNAILFSFRHNHDQVVVAGLGSQVAKAFDVSERAAEVLELEWAGVETFEADGLLGVRITLKNGTKGVTTQEK